MGPAGLNGIDGTAGTNGTNGTDGTPGTNGTGTTGATGPTGPTGPNGLIGGIVLYSGSITDIELEAAFASTETTVILAGVTDVYGVVPANKTLRVLGDVSVASGEALILNGALDLFLDSAALQAEGDSNGGLIVEAGGTISGLGALYLPIDTDDTYTGDYTTYVDVAYAHKAIGSTVASGSVSAFNPASTTVAEVLTIFGVEGGPDALTVEDLANIEAGTIPLGKTLTITGASNSLVTGASTFAPAGTLVNEGTISTDTTADVVVCALLAASAAEGGTVTASGAITTLTADLSVPAGVSLSLTNSSATLAAGDYNISVAGDLAIETSVDLAPLGNITVTGNVVTIGSITVADGKYLDVTGATSRQSRIKLRVKTT
jgi:hypothetical protein